MYIKILIENRKEIIMKKFILTLFSVLFLITVSYRPVSADIGPKPSIHISFTEGPEHPVYVTLLAEKEAYGPHHALEFAREEHQEEDEAFIKAAHDSGFYYWADCDLIESGEEFVWGYYPPDVFKVAVYDPVTKEIKVSDTYERYAFEARYELDLKTMKVIEKSDSVKEMRNFALRLFATLAVELLIALLFGYKSKKELLIIFIVNIITQGLLNIFLTAGEISMGAWVWMLIMPIGEIVVMILEMIIYWFTLKSHKKGRAALYALCANFVTFLLTFYSAGLSIL